MSVTTLPDKSETPRMFSSIAGRYDFLNHFLSLNIDRAWRRRLVRLSGATENSRVLDVATGTGDVALAFANAGVEDVIGLDPADGMLEIGRAKVERAGFSQRVRMIEGDALTMPFPSHTFDVLTIAFGLRNLPDYRAGLREMTRVLRPGGRLLVLEFFPPRGGAFLPLYRFYLGRVLPVVGSIVSGSREAYRYLAASIESFVSHEEMTTMMMEAGIGEVNRTRLTGGIACIYHGIVEKADT